MVIIRVLIGGVPDGESCLSMPKSVFVFSFVGMENQGETNVPDHRQVCSFVFERALHCHNSLYIFTVCLLVITFLVELDLIKNEECLASFCNVGRLVVVLIGTDQITSNANITQHIDCLWQSLASIYGDISFIVYSFTIV